MARNTSEANLQTAPDQKLEGNNVKSLNDLPDDILGHILSFMRTRDAVRTSILSKRWKYLRILTPNLVFNDGEFFCWWSIIIHQEGFELLKYVREYVTREIHLRSFVRSFRFEACHFSRTVSALLRYCIPELVKRNVQEVYLLLDSTEEDMPPDCLFTCESLVHFQFHVEDIILRLQLPSTICLSHLKSLSLRHIQFSDAHSTNQLFSCSCCPMLEDLTLSSCRWSKDIKLVKICAPKLLRLTISERPYHRDSTNSHSCRIAVFGPYLTHFVYSGDFHNEPYLYDAKSIQKACVRQVYLHPTTMRDMHPDRVYRLLQCLSNVKYLDLLGLDYEVPEGVEKLLNDMPMFKNLIRLDIRGSKFDGSSRLSSNIGLMKLLMNSPRLEVFKPSYVPRLPQVQDEMDPMPPCFYTHLKIVEVQITDGCESINALKSLLRNALVLQKMVVSIRNSKKHNPWKREILRLPKASKDCKVIVK